LLYIVLRRRLTAPLNLRRKTTPGGASVLSHLRDKLGDKRDLFNEEEMFAASGEEK
jgi:hypothetical protein